MSRKEKHLFIKEWKGTENFKTKRIFGPYGRGGKHKQSMPSENLVVREVDKFSEDGAQQTAQDLKGKGASHFSPVNREKAHRKGGELST